MNNTNPNNDTNGKQHPLDAYTVQPKSDSGEKSPYYQSQAPAISLPKGGGALKGIDEKFSVNAINGTASLQVPFPLSPGRGGFTPALSLSYNSGSGNSEFGLGWGMSLPAIQRKTDKKLPQYNDAAESDIFLLAGAEDLIPMLREDGTVWTDDVTIGQNTYHVKRYRPRIEGLFARIELISPVNSIEKWWRVTTKDNSTTWYGLNPDAQIYAPGDQSRIYKWLPQLSIDNKGNVQQFIYKEENLDSVSTALHERNRFNGKALFTNKYLKNIRYCNRIPYTLTSDVYNPALPSGTFLMEAVLDYGEHTNDTNGIASYQPVSKWVCRTDPFSDFHAGFEIRTYRKCKRVLMFHRFDELGIDENSVLIPTLVRSLDLVYQHDGNNDLQEADFITTITQTGYRQIADGSWQAKSLPPMVLDYQPLQWNTAIESVSAENTINAPQGLTGAYQWTDLYGEGLPGILTEQADGWFYKSNLGDGQFTPAMRVATKPSFSGLGTELQWQDLDADGRRQVVVRDGAMPGYFQVSPTTEMKEDKPMEWEPFCNFKHNVNVDWNSPFTKMLDLDGDGRADLLLTEDGVWTWYKNEGTAGISEGGRTTTVFDEEKGPRLVLNDDVQSIFLADMNGDGMTDIVRIKNGEICYWPNMGYGRFGAKVTMGNAPVFASSDLYNPLYLSLSDISGTGAADIIYLGQNKCTAWINLAGNAWSAAQDINPLPSVEPYSKIAVLDFLGNGTGCIVWSSPLPRHANAPMQYIDLMGGNKPYIMRGYSNSMGKTVALQYKSSSKYYLEDKAAGTPWATRLPFPVQCLSRVTTTDTVSETTYAQNYSYHHGYYDHEEREFRGFGRVDTVDIDSASFYAPPINQSTNQPLNQPPVQTKTWYHTGAWLRESTLLNQYEKEYYSLNGDVVLPNSITQLSVLNPQELREALRALKGSPLRQEVYALDDSSKQSIPYTITTSSYCTRLVQPLKQNRYASFLTWQQESLAWSCERNPQDPRVQHSLTLEVDAYGNVLQSASIAYGRKTVAAGTPTLAGTEQQKMHVVVSKTKYTNDITNNAQYYRLRVPYQSAAYEAALTGITDTSAVLSFTDAVTKINAATQTLLSCSRSVFAKDSDLSAALSLATIEPLGMPWQQFTLAFDQAMITASYDSSVGQAILSEGKYLRSSDVSAFNGIADEGTGWWWIPSGTVQFSAMPANDFYSPVAFTDPWSNQATISYWNDYHLLPQSVTDAVSNTNTVLDYNWYNLQPVGMKDENDNISAICYDALGMPVATAMEGKGNEADYLQTSNGDALIAGSTTDTAAQTAFWAAIDTNNTIATDTAAKALLGRATWRCLYNLSSQPTRVAMIAREDHYTLNANSTVIIRISYSDGLGRIAMHKAQCELPSSGGAGGGSGWIGSGKTVYNNKGKIVLQYEPYFSDTAAYDHALQASLPSASGGGAGGGGVSPRMYYDPLGRLFKTEMPDGSLSYTEWDGWKQIVYDANDLLGNMVNGVFTPGITTASGVVLSEAWYNAHNNSTTPEEKDAAKKASVHADTPTVMYLDSLARPFYTVLHNRQQAAGGAISADSFIESYVVLDIMGNHLAVIDGLGRTQLQYKYNYVKAPCWQSSIDGGTQQSLTDVGGQPLYHWDAANNVFHFTYDTLRRPLNKEVYSAGWWMALEKSVYGEGQTDDKLNNLRGKLYQHYDSSSVQTVATYDFKGIPKASTRLMIADSSKADAEWTLYPSALDTANPLTTTITYNALGQVLKQTDPGGNETYHSYDKGGLLNGVSLKPNGSSTPTVYVQDIHYDAKGQRQSIWYGNGTKTTYTYDPFTYRLRRMVTRKASATDALQDLNYYYDAVGNITTIRDDAQDVLFYNNSIIEPVKCFTYDALYRLIKAEGREQIGAQTSGSNDNVFDMGHMASATNASAVQNYTQYYTYDAVGNILFLQHNASPATSYTRTYTYDTASNRLLSTQVGSNTYNYTYDARGNMITMPHLQHMVWDKQNQLVSVTTGDVITFYQYSGGQRVRKSTIKGAVMEQRVYMGSYETYLRTNWTNPELARSTVHISDDAGRIAMLETRTLGTDDAPAILQRYIYSNHLGSATLELDNTAAIISYEEYHPYGTTSYQANNDTIKAVAKRYRFTGKERDEESGLYYHGARYYAPWLGRWTAVDPLEGKYAGWSAYQYCTCNPTMNTDSTGMGNDGDIKKGPAEDPNNLKPQSQVYEFGHGSEYVVNATDKASGNKKDFWIFNEQHTDGNKYFYFDASGNSGKGNWELFWDDKKVNSDRAKAANDATNAIAIGFGTGIAVAITAPIIVASAPAIWAGFVEASPFLAEMQGVNLTAVGYGSFAGAGYLAYESASTEGAVMNSSSYVPKANISSIWESEVTSGNQRNYFINGEKIGESSISNGGYLSFDINIPVDMQKQGYASQIIGDAIDFYSGQGKVIKGINAKWMTSSIYEDGMSSNLKSFTENYIHGNMSYSEAALNTPTGKIAAKNGFTKVVPQDWDALELGDSKPAQIYWMELKFIRP